MEDLVGAFLQKLLENFFTYRLLFECHCPHRLFQSFKRNSSSSATKYLLKWFLGSGFDAEVTGKSFVYPLEGADSRIDFSGFNRYKISLGNVRSFR